jgi:hypothetical protein
MLAGFSAAAGIPMTASLFEQAIRLFSSECPGVFRHVRNCAPVAFGLGDSEPDYKDIGRSGSVYVLDSRLVMIQPEHGPQNGSSHVRGLIANSIM